MTEVTTKTQVNDPQRPNLSVLQRFWFAAGDLGCNCAYRMIGSYLQYFMTDVALINPTTVGTVMLFSKVWDAVIDPFIGYAADRTNTRFGRYRPWVIGAAIPMVVLNVLAFTTNPEWSQTTRTWFAFGAYFASVTAYSCLNIPYSAMSATLTLDGDMRGKLASMRIFGANVAGLFFSFYALRIVNWIKAARGGSEGDGFQMAAIIFGAAALPFFIMCFLGVKEVVHAEPTKAKYSTMFRCLRKNPPLWGITLYFIIVGLNGFGSSNMMYFFTYVAKKQIMQANNSTISSIFSILGTLSVSFFVTRAKNKGHILAAGATVSTIIGCIKAFLPVATPAGEYTYYALTVISGYAGGVNLATMFAILPDVTEYSRYHHGVYAAGFLSSFVNFAFQFGGALASASAGWVLGAFGYVPGAEQSQQMLNWFTYMSHLWPAAMTAIGAIVMIRYPLSRDKFNEIVAHLEKGELAPGVVAVE